MSKKEDTLEDTLEDTKASDPEVIETNNIVLKTTKDNTKSNDITLVPRKKTKEDMDLIDTKELESDLLNDKYLIRKIDISKKRLSLVTLTNKSGFTIVYKDSEFIVKSTNTRSKLNIKNKDILYRLFRVANILI